MARAKRTDRADARRRYRATQSDVPESEGEDLEEAEAAPEPTRSPFWRGRTTTAASPATSTASKRPVSARSSATSQPSLPPGQRPSFTGAFRAAARPFDFRSDISYIRTLILRTRAVWIPAALALAAFVLTLVVNGPNTLIALLVQLFLYPPTIAGAFLAGILAPRATYIAGGIAGLIGSVLFVTLVLVAPARIVALSTTPTASVAPSDSAGSSLASGAPSPAAAAPASPDPSPTPAPSAIDVTSASTVSAIAQSILVSTVFGIAIGAFGGYYKRFLYLSNPGRQRRAAEQQRAKAQRPQPGKRRY